MIYFFSDYNHIFKTKDENIQHFAVSWKFFFKNNFHDLSFQTIDQKAWIQDNFPKDTRYESVIITAKDGDNVLSNITIQYVSQFDYRIIVYIINASKILYVILSDSKITRKDFKYTHIYWWHIHWFMCEVRIFSHYYECIEYQSFYFYFYIDFHLYLRQARNSVLPAVY